MADKYTTSQGDMWDMIARRTMGSEMGMNELMAANPQYVGVLIFSAGLVLNVPKYKTSSDYPLPPWS